MVRPPGLGSEAGERPREVLIVRRLGAARSVARRRRGRVRPVEGHEGPPLPLTRFLVARPDSFADESEAADWLERIGGDHEQAEALIKHAVATVNRALHAYRASAQSPHLTQLSTDDAYAERIGYGTGDEVADGRWTAAQELLPRERRSSLRSRVADLQPQERLASVLGGREQIAACETLLLRARADLDAGRTREAALQLVIGLDALLAEVRGSASPALEEAIGELAAGRDAAGSAAQSALAGPLRESEADSVRELLTAAEALMRRHLLSTRS